MFPWMISWDIWCTSMREALGGEVGVWVVLYVVIACEVMAMGTVVVCGLACTNGGAGGSLAHLYMGGIGLCVLCLMCSCVVHNVLCCGSADIWVLCVGGIIFVVVSVVEMYTVVFGGCGVVLVIGVH